MTPESDQSFQDDLSAQNTRRWLIRSLYFMVVAEIAMIALTIVLLFWIASQCITVYGIALSGALFPTDSFSCPNPQVTQLYPRSQ